MQVEIKIDDNCIEPKVIIITDKVTDEINDILNMLSSKTPEVITGFYNDLAEILSPDDIIRIYAEDGKIFASVNSKEYILSHCLQNKQSVKFSINSAFFIEMCYNKCKKIIKSNKKACT